MKRKILIVNQNSGYLTIDVANTFKEKYEEVVVMYGMNRVTERNFHPDIKIQKTIKYNRSSTVKRLWTWGVCTLHLFFLLLFKYRGYHVLYYTNPPMSYFNALFFSNPFSIVVFDTYPDALRLIGIKESSFVYRIWKKVNKKVFSKAVQIITLSEGMKKQLGNYVNDEKVKVVSVWSASDTFKPIAKDSNLFLKKHKWVDKFIVLYSGNMGIGHKLEVLIDVAKQLEDKKEILFLFVGEGAKKNTLIDLASKYKLQNVHFLTWQDAETLPYSLAAGDLAVVALEPEATHASVPSKTFNYMAVGAPLLAIGSTGSELEKLIKRHRLGFYTDGKDVSEIKNYVLKMLSNKDKVEQLSRNSFQASKNFNYEMAIQYVF
ncbi:glycosyltransferase family 4 protein [Cecembia lonarensis]|uniref:Putative glycosyl transferase n=1 Tax=Cecembia lonarensis (strain CCUG 58316 / KCTC 22772 / LW9) TaxID=1225176 RepID=K1KYB7_CECL9|nr:glycosyltransferase family 4 protein [Cecembia lonarensis]EKB49130.1 putative glycosyl transferase [Cecembia lonarensis LW9]